jgi:hypothetical protein
MWKLIETALIQEPKRATTYLRVLEEGGKLRLFVQTDARESALLDIRHPAN